MYVSNQPKPFRKEYKPVNFNGLTRDMKKIACKDASEIIRIIEKHPKSNGIVGNLPYEWISRIPKENRQETIKDFYKNMKNVFNERKNINVHTLKQNFIKAGIIPSTEDLELQYENFGGYGEVYKLRIKNDKNEYALKVFKGNEATSYCGGNYVELNKAAYWQKQAGSDTNWAKFYFGDTDAGYMVNKFISKDTPICSKQTPMDIYGLKAEKENDRNIINGYNVDYGTMRIISEELVKNKTARAIYKKISKLKLEQRTQAFDRYLKLNDENVNISLMNSLKLLINKKEIEKYFKILNANKSNKVKEKFLNQLIINPYDYPITECYKELAHKSDNEFKIILLSKLQYIPRKDRLGCYKLLAKGANIKTRVLLFQNSYCVDKNNNKLNCLWPLLIP